MNLEKKNKHIRDSHIQFDEKPHIYYIDDKKVETSVTSFIHNFFPEFNGNKIAELCVKKGRNNEKSEYFGMTKTMVLNKWEKNRVLAAELGTALHKSIELFYNDEICDDDIVNSQEYSFFKDFVKDNDMIPYRTEWEVYHEEANLAGSIDMVFKNDDGSYSIYDWKRSKKIEKSSKYEFGKEPLDHLPHCNFWHYSLQLNTYKYILETKYNLNIKDMYLVVLHPNFKKYQKVIVPNLQTDVNLIISNRIENFISSD